MCGITGILSLSPDARVDAESLRLMAKQLTHRGPDDEGYYLDSRGRCGLGFRRLSIIDLAGGHQPLTNEDETVWIVFNGEIYNFRELRRDLENRGHRFRTNTDGEVIVHLYEEQGTQCFSALAGMFAIALWDSREGSLILARDRFGKKPLVYGRQGGSFYFASEIKAILALPGVTRKLDPQALHEYLIFQYVPAPLSIYRGFQKLSPGHWIKLIHDAAATTGEPVQQAYWRVPRPEERRTKAFRGTYEDAKRRLGELLTKAVEKRLLADVPLGAFLSGGIDSSIVVALMRKLGVSPLRTFSIGFPDPRYDETAYARRVAKEFGTEHHEHIVTPRAADVLDTLAWHYDEPFADSSAIPTYYVSRYTRGYVTVALTGDAGDECFAGYDRYLAARLAARFDWIPAGFRYAAATLAGVLPHRTAKSVTNRAYRFLSALGQNPARRYLSWINIFPHALLAEGYHPGFAERLSFEEPLDWFDSLYSNEPGTAAECANYVDFVSYLPFDLLTKVDIASMACSLECRSPFLDHELVEFALSLPIEWRLGRKGGKRILKDWAADILPGEVLNRTKMGFGIPVGEWFRGELRSLLEEHLLSTESISRRIFDEKWLRGILNSHITGRINFEHPLWALLSLELWGRRWQPVGI